jgi:hypothetical protein
MTSASWVFFSSFFVLIFFLPPQLEKAWVPTAVGTKAQILTQLLVKNINTDAAAGTKVEILTQLQGRHRV